MAILTYLIGATVAGGTFAWARKRRIGAGKSAVAGALVGTGAAVATAIVLPWVVTAAILGIPIAAGYYIVKGTGNDRRALPPSHDD
jgi:hypothetical protein